MAKLAILGASYLQLPLVLKARELGHISICLAWEDGAVCQDHCDKYYPISITDKEKVLEVCQKEKIDGITSIATDVAVPTMAYVAGQMGLTGNSVRSSLLSTNKFLMREAFAKNSLPIPGFRIIRSIDDLHTLEALSYPLIIKPVDRSGSLGITMIRSHDQLEEALKYALETSFSHQAIIEEFIEGREISVETISWKGKHYILAYTDKVTSGYPHFVELEHHQPSMLVTDEIRPALDQLVVKSLDALEIEFGASHAEFIINDRKEIFITEIGARMGGDFIGSDLVMLSTGYDYLSGIIEIALGGFSVPELQGRDYAGVYFYTVYSKNVKSLAKLKPKCIIRAQLDSSLNKKLKQSADRSGYFVYKSPEKKYL
ncbi:MAG: ATP-grasp domain-containing protein [Desulfobacteraceae bacterium]|jgi:biotin carboxylase|nr:ATP-grasp domain-containing protein [Desulfobacteraceae bacterium]